jgi:hypothetical protein
VESEVGSASLCSDLKYLQSLVCDFLCKPCKFASIGGTIYPAFSWISWIHLSIKQVATVATVATSNLTSFFQPSNVVWAQWAVRNAAGFGSPSPVQPLGAVLNGMDMGWRWDGDGRWTIAAYFRN